MKSIFYIIIILFLLGCKKQPFDALVVKKGKTAHQLQQFSMVPSSQTNIDFKNSIKETSDLNFLNFGNIYNGTGVAAGDFNNDGLVDLYFVANQKSNKLYLNQGGLNFRDVTEKSGLKDDDGWSTGVSVIDINNDGWLDIYVCKSGELNNDFLRQNKLFVNQKDGTFVEEAKKWKINDPGFSTQSYFFDYDKDGDIDMYLVNHRPDFHNTARLNMGIEKAYSRMSSDILYRNDGTGFTEVTHKAGLVNKTWGLSAAIGDFNNDSWPDIYVCNDFLTPDMLYINNKNGTFTNRVLESMNHISFSSMGSDFADINNDLLPDLFVAEMAMSDHVRSKKNMPSMSTKAFVNLVNKKYHHQYMLNTLQLNTGTGHFSEIAQLSGVAKTDWSWAPLIADFDNDGLNDIFITNGILRDMGNQDFRNQLKELYSESKNPDFKKVIDLMPTTKIENLIYKNKGNLSFAGVTYDWGFGIKTQSNGAVYADLDKDGDLDLVVNNINDTAHIYRNNDINNFLQLKLVGDVKNRLGIGSKVTLKSKQGKQYKEMFLSRGYLSSVENVLHFGLGNTGKVDSLTIEWTDGKMTHLNNIEANQIITVHKERIPKSPVKAKKKHKSPLLKAIKPFEKGIAYKHKENEFDDYKHQILLPHSQSRNGPFVAKADVNNDGLEDFYLGGAKGQSGELYIQDGNGSFVKKASQLFEADKAYEDLGVLFFDADNDKDSDLYVVSGGSEFEEHSSMYQDRLYLNDGTGNFIKSIGVLPKINSSGQCVKASDFDKDGDLDLFVGGRVIPDKYPYAPESLLLINENGKFVNKTDIVAPYVKDIGMVTDALFTDFDNDGDDDLIIVGEWMPVVFLENNEGKFDYRNIPSIQNSEGLWFSIEAMDIGKDGDEDYFVGNLGLNTKFKANPKKPFHVFCDDFDNSGTYDVVLTTNYNGQLVPSRGKECSSQQMPFIKEKFPTFKSFAEATLKDIYSEEKLSTALHYEAKLLEHIFIENLGGGNFKIKKLPKETQISPVMGFEPIDINHDGTKEILLVGNHYDSEVETVRYDASYGAVLDYRNGNFKVLDVLQTGFFNKGNAKDITTLNIKGATHILVTNNNHHIGLFGKRVRRP